ncbi:MAG: DUF1461 domain-containing protein [Marinagarivorans sp.]|nr:DUF1461 domain-containing protein [Marinagarivorans sp.]
MAWLLLYKISFSYGIWHDVGKLGWAIDRYGPENRNRTGFADTTKVEREALFEQINVAVHRNGQGLELITYTVAGHPTQTLLTQDEVLHLTDVAHLVNKVAVLVFAGTLLWILMAIYYCRARLLPPSWLNQCLALLGVILFFTAILMLIGPAKAFSKMHEWVFPPGHPWFFYYQQSLMSTMMWAPRLFAWVAVEWAVFTVIFFSVVQYFINVLLNRLHRNAVIKR